MNLYHFTALEYLVPILKRGIVRGDVPTSPHEGFNAPWLTDDKSWDSQRWSTGSVLNKERVRLTVDIPNAEEDWNLKKWSTFHKYLKVDSRWYSILDEVAGGGSDNWFIYIGIVDPDWITRVEVKDYKDRPLLLEI
tara:strand:- start:1133 stop:1540 length:408 start_codon:yes stop_codon:yes gene_type:complete